MNIEAQHQIAVVQYLRTNYPDVLFTIAPANAKNARTGKKNKDMGYTAGTPDIMIFEPRRRDGAFHALFIELKRPENKFLGIKKGTTSTIQKKYIEKLNSMGYLATICYGSEEACKVIDGYLRFPMPTATDQLKEIDRGIRQ